MQTFLFASDCDILLYQAKVNRKPILGPLG